MKREILRIENITTMDKGIKTLDDFFLNLYQGELLGVFVNNTTEKKHLIDLIYGNVEVERGRICYDNMPVTYEDYVGIRKNKISMIQSTSKLVDDLSVADNIFVIRDRFGRYIIDRRVISVQTRNLLEELELEMDPHKLSYLLSDYERTVIEVVKAYGLGAKIIILKDLSSYLSDSELDRLLPIIDRLKGSGVSFIMIDSFAQILSQFADRMFVLSNGRNVWTFKSGQFSEDILNNHFNTSGQEIPGDAYVRKEQALRFEGVSTNRLEPLSFEIHSGELLCILDHDGREIDEITKILNCTSISHEGKVYVGGKPFCCHSPDEAVKNGLALMVENPRETMLFKDITAIDNLFFVSGNKENSFWMNTKYRKSCVEAYESFFEKGVLSRQTKNLSVYDLQKLAYLKWHFYNPRVIVCIRPFSSIDAELRTVTAEMLRLLLEKGIGILVLASNDSEVYSSGKRILLRPKE